MYIHAPDGYTCPICLGVQGTENEHTLLKQADLVYTDELVCAFINSFWVEAAKGHVIVVPREHCENVYEISSTVGQRLFEVSQKIAIAMKKAYQCQGITMRQNNEPAGDQHAFHYHLHVYPRYEGDLFNKQMSEKSILSAPEERVRYATLLRAELG